MSDNKTKNDKPAIKPLEKDFAHYPATDKKQVGLDAKAKKDDDEKNACGNKDAEHQNTAMPGPLPGTDTKIVNGSNKVVNEDEPYSNGSGGAFEATERVND